MEVGKHLSLVSLVAIGLVLMGHLYFSSYYFHFGINISEFFDPSEILLLFSQVLYKLLPIFLLPILSIQLAKWRSKTQNLETPIKKKNYLFKIYLLGCIPLTGLITVFILSINNSPEYFTDLVGYLICLALPITLLLAYLDGYLADVISKPRFTKIIILTISMTSIYFMIRNAIEASKILDGETKYEVQLITNDREIETTKDLMYIGSIRNYYFFRDIKTNINLIIPTSEVKEAKIKRVRRTI